MLSKIKRLTLKGNKRNRPLPLIPKADNNVNSNLF